MISYEERRYYEERRGGPSEATSAPTISFPPEVASAIKEIAQHNLEYLKPFVDEVAEAKQTLSMYLHDIVARENIQAGGD